MYILHTIASLDPRHGGPSKSVAELAGACVCQGLDVGIWTPEQQPAEWTRSLRDQGISLSHGSLDDLLTSAKRPTVIHDHGVWLMVNHGTAATARKHKIPRIVSPRGMLEPWAMQYRKWKKKLAWLLYQRRDLASASALHATSDSEASNLRSLGLRCHVFVVPNGVATQRKTDSVDDRPTPPVDRSPTAARNAVFLSRIHPKKGLPLLAEAWNRVRPEGWRMVVIGPDEAGHRAEIEGLVGRLKVKESWIFLDQVNSDQKWRHLSEADVMILPTYSENFGNVIAESLSVGTPVITTTGTPWEGLASRGCGWWIPPTILELERALRSATSMSKPQLRQMGLRGKDWIETEFTWERIAVQMADAYDVVVSESRSVSR